MPSEKELLERIRQLEEQNNDLQDKLDASYAILAPDYEQFPVDEMDETDDGEPSSGLVNIKPA